MLINTSFNENEPVVLTQLALDTFLRTDMDAMVLKMLFCKSRKNSFYWVLYH